MRYSTVMLKAYNRFKNDPLDSFISGFTFIPNGFGHQYNNPKAICGDRIIGDFELIYILGGESNVAIENQTYTCGAGDMVLIPPFTKHSIGTPASNPHENYWIHFDVFPFYRQEDFISAMLPSGEYRIHIGIRDELISLYKLIEKEVSLEQPGCRVFISTLLLQVITLVLRLGNACNFSSVRNSRKDSPEKLIVDKSVEYIYQNMANTIRIADICRHLHISESYLFKSFIKVLKLPPNQFIQIVKIKRAEQMIKSSSLSFKEISNALGFSSPYYFSSVFKKHYKVSPKEYLHSLVN